MKNIREEKGYTYGINSGVLHITLQHTKSSALRSVQNIQKMQSRRYYNEIRLLQQDPVGKDEMEIVRNFMLGEMVRMFDGPFALADSFRAAWEFGLRQFILL